jgi:hypothetical protein
LEVEKKIYFTLKSITFYIFISDPYTTDIYIRAVCIRVTVCLLFSQHSFFAGTTLGESTKSVAEKKAVAENSKTSVSKNKPDSEDKSASSAAENGGELDVESMMKDFSDKLQENLLPDPWD